MNDPSVRKEVTRRILRVSVHAWLIRLPLIGFLAYPLYATLANSTLLRGVRGDEGLFAAGSERLASLVFVRMGALLDLWVPLTLLAILVAGMAILLSCYVWVALDPHMPRTRARTWRAMRNVLPSFAAITVGSVAATFSILWLWWHFFPILGALLEPWLGERGTDLAQLSVLLGALASAGLVWLVGDLTRAVLLLQRSSVLEALPTALEILRRQPLLVVLHATGRFGLALGLELVHGWVVARFGWLSGSALLVLLAVVQGEVVAWCAVWLRITWIVRIRGLASRYVDEWQTPPCDGERVSGNALT